MEWGGGYFIGTLGESTDNKIFLVPNGFKILIKHLKLKVFEKGGKTDIYLFYQGRLSPLAS